jgi:hypothetical protein
LSFLAREALLAILVYNVIVSGFLAAYRPASSDPGSSKRVSPSLQRVQTGGLAKVNIKGHCYTKLVLGAIPILCHLEMISMLGAGNDRVSAELTVNPESDLWHISLSGWKLSQT